MASTPPAQILYEARTPPTPLHGSAYHSQPSPSRYNTRSSSRKISGSTLDVSLQSNHSPVSPQPPDLHFHSPRSASKQKSHRPQIFSPASSTSGTPEPTHRLPQNSTHLSATTIISEGMLPTPVKTPQKKQIPKSAMAARMLFQDQPNAITDSPRKNQKKKVRHNGFSLESFSENPSQDQVQIHIDSRDQIPEIDPSADNPFYVAPESSSKKRPMASAQDVLRSSKRRKVAEEGAPLDSRVKDAIEKDEGMVYVFRGTKVYKRFDDTGDEEEVIDPEELGLLVNETDAAEIIKPLKTLTRKSIRPKRLFQTEKHLSQIDEEADTEIEDNQKEIEPKEEQPSPSRTTRSSGAGSKKKRTSPFDSWQRLKPGSRSAGSDPSTKSRKRTAAEASGL